MRLYNGRMASIIVACDPNFLIGTADNKIPWNIPEDMRFFKETTLNHPIIMGRKTWDSLPKKPLPRRFNIVVSRSTPSSTDEDTIEHNGPMFVSCIQDAVDMATWYMPSREPFIIGGAQIYREALKEGLVDRILMTTIRKEYVGTVYFPCPTAIGFDKCSIIKEHPEFIIEEYVGIK
jgi:dihydrofolate reductase